VQPIASYPLAQPIFKAVGIVGADDDGALSRLQAASAQCCERYEGQPIRLPFFIAFSVSYSF
jgi:hypothetical protein